ncbi:MAG: twin-arginine translocation signal domain-containing protein [Verrucomicrobiota bacterium]
MKPTASKQKPSGKGRALSRRQFLGGATLASAGLMILPSRVLGRGGSSRPTRS